MRVLTVIGTRPEAIKMAPVLGCLQRTKSITPLLCVTGQHRQMLDQVLDLFGLCPDHDLNLMRANQGLAWITTTVLERIAEVYAALLPDRVLVQGDTTTSFAAALAAFYGGIPVGHVEAGLRTSNPRLPWPEEMNRRLTTRLADLHFCPTDTARDNLIRENVNPASIYVTGNTVIDALFNALAVLDSDPRQAEAVSRQLPSIAPHRRLVLVTGHRRENLDGGLDRVAEGLLRLAARDDVEIVYPVHLNPKVQSVAQNRLAGHPFIHLIPPLDYLPFVLLMRRAHIIITDSGGIQEEAPSLGKPVLVIRDATERPEAVAAGTVDLVGTDIERLVQRASRLLDDPEAYGQMSVAHNPYGDGRAAPRIVKAIVRAHGLTQVGRCRARRHA